MSRRYEIVYIFDSALEEAQVNEHLERFHALLINNDNPEPITNTNHDPLVVGLVVREMEIGTGSFEVGVAGTRGT